jgi:hypothetical protein
MEHGLLKPVIAPGSTALHLQMRGSFPFHQRNYRSASVIFILHDVEDGGSIVPSLLSMPIEIPHKRLVQGVLLSLGINTRRIDDLSTSSAPVSL